MAVVNPVSAYCLKGWAKVEHLQHLFCVIFCDFNMKALHMLVFLILVVGGLNWLLVGLFGWDVGQIFGGQNAVVSRVIYVLVGLSALWLLVSHKKDCRMCGPSGAGM